MNIHKFWKAVLAQNEIEIRNFFHQDASINWHCTNEHFTVEEFIIANCEYPGEWDGTVERTETINDLIITVTRVYPKDQSASFHVTSFIKIKDKKIISLDEYWADDGIAPQWRLDKHIGVPIHAKIGLQRGTVSLVPHQAEWDSDAAQTIQKLKHLLGTVAIDIQHVGSTAIPSIHAKPIIDITIGVHDLEDIVPYINILENNDFIFRGEDVSRQILFVKGDFEKDSRSHHIHVVNWNDTEWNNYINFRDYLNAFPEKAMDYDKLKQTLAIRFPKDRQKYTEGKQSLIDTFLEEARLWKTQL